MSAGGRAVLDTRTLMDVAERQGVCVRPFLRQVTDRATDATTTVPIPCGSTRAAVCPTCADKARRLRMHQCREGWHLTDEPATNDADTQAPDDEDQDDGEDQDDDLLADDAERLVRSTRRRAEVPDLPRVPMADATTGRVYTDPKTGRVFRPSMFLTLTLPSRGQITPKRGYPVNPAAYDYTGAAFDALLFARLVDRFWQNLRRCAGYKVQYFAAVEPQRRLAPHLHAAIRGTIPRAVMRQVVAATYASIWWPRVDEVRYDVDRGDLPPIWHEPTDTYRDPRTGAPLPSWKDATGDLDDPLVVLRFGKQTDLKGLLGGTADSDRAVRYLCKYLTKATAETYTDPGANPDSEHVRAYAAHIDRLHAQVRVLPCSERCANWLRHGVTPKDPGPGLVPGQCPAKAHDRECLGLGGRRVLVSRRWSGKTLTEHKADRASVVREVLQAAGYAPEDAGRMAADVLHTDGQPRYVWQDVPHDQHHYADVITASVRQAVAWRAQYEHAKTLAHPGAPPGGGPVDSHSATPTAA